MQQSHLELYDPGAGETSYPTQVLQHRRLSLGILSTNVCFNYFFENSKRKPIIVFHHTI